MKIIFLLITSLLSGCSSSLETIESSKIASGFYIKNIAISDQIKEIKKYHIAEQYDIFEFGNRIIHPPAIYLAKPIAEQGKTIIPFLKEKLQTTSDEVTIRDIVLIISEMVELKNYELSKDSELIKLLEQKINNMEGIWKNFTYKLFSEIRDYTVQRGS